MCVLKTNDFIKKANIIHKSKYVYIGEYINSKTKMDIFCLNCNKKFKQRPNNHLSGQGCPICAKRCKKMTHNEFTKRSNKIHSYKYLYNDMYINNKTNIDIFCKICNSDFKQKPLRHLNGHGCPICSNNSRKLTHVEFVSKANEVHDVKFTYPELYNGRNYKILINCSVCHTEFRQNAGNHLNGHGCPTCNINSKKMTHVEFVNISNIKHNNGYEYIENYKGVFEKILILCNSCGSKFSQIPHNHMRGVGCPVCRMSKVEREIIKELDKLNVEYVKQHSFTGCKYKSVLKFDFYLPEYNICIEYDGVQHFIVNEHFGGELGFKNTLRNDNIKNNYCKINNIKLIRIPYTEFDNIANIIEEELP